MINRLLLFLFLVTCASSMNAQQSASISSAEVSFNFVSKDVDGTISGFASSSSLNLNTLTDSKFKGSVDVETIKTGNFLRDWSLKGSKYFDADAHPKITFESTAVSETDTGFSVKGALNIKGISKSVTIDFKRQDMQLIGTVILFSSDFGIEIKNDRPDNEVKVKLALKLKS